MIVVDDNMPLALRDLAQHVAEKNEGWWKRVVRPKCEAFCWVIAVFNEITKHLLTFTVCFLMF